MQRLAGAERRQIQAGMRGGQDGQSDELALHCSPGCLNLEPRCTYAQSCTRLVALVHAASRRCFDLSTHSHTAHVVPYPNVRGLHPSPSHLARLSSLIRFVGPIPVLSLRILVSLACLSAPLPASVSAMAKKKNHTAQNQNKKAHKNGIHRPKRQKYISLKGVSSNAHASTPTSCLPYRHLHAPLHASSTDTPTLRQPLRLPAGTPPPRHSTADCLQPHCLPALARDSPTRPVDPPPTNLPLAPVKCGQ